MHRSHHRFALAASLATNGLGMLATGAMAMALPWSILSTGGGAIQAGVVAAVVHVALAIGMFVGGALVDRLQPRAVVVVTDAAALVGAVMAVWAATQGSGWAAVLCCAMVNLVGAPGTVAQDARVPELAALSGVSLERANGLRDLAAGLGQIAGPASGVVLVDAVGVSGALAVVALVLGLTLLIDAVWFPPLAVAGRGSQPGRGATAGWRLLVADPALRTVAVLGIVLVGILVSLDEILVPSLALAQGLDGTRVAGFLASLSGASLVGVLGYLAVGRRLAGRTILISGIGCAAAGLGLLALDPDAGRAFLVAPLLIGLGTGPLWPVVVTAIHRRVPVAVCGSVIGVLGGCVLLAQPVASVVAGPATVLLGIRGVLAIVAVLAAVMLVVAMLVPSLRAIDGPPQETGPR
jgi:MFS family permease